MSLYSSLPQTQQRYLFFSVDTADLDFHVSAIISRDQMLESFLSTSRHKFAPLCEVSAAIAKSDASSQR